MPPAKSRTVPVQISMLNKRLVVFIACLPHGRHGRDDLPGHRMSGIDRSYSMRQHPFIVIFKSIISALYRADGRPHDSILDAPIDGPWQFQSGRLRPTRFIFSAGHPHQSNATVSMWLRSVLEPPRRIEVGENGRRANPTNTRKLTPRLDNRIFTGVGSELFLRDLHLLVGTEYLATMRPLCSMASSVLLLCTSAPM